MSTPSTEIEMVKIGEARNTFITMKLKQVKQNLIDSFIYLFSYLGCR
jgi:hypothetical protein